MLLEGERTTLLNTAEMLCEMKTEFFTAQSSREASDLHKTVWHEWGYSQTRFAQSSELKGPQ